MQPRFPFFRSLFTALLLALAVAAGVEVTARLTLPPGALAPGWPQPAVPTPGVLGEKGPGGGGQGGTAGPAAAPPGASSEAGRSSEPTGNEGDRDRDSLLDGRGANLPLGREPAAPPVPAASRIGHVLSELPSTWQEVITAPERWLVLAAFAGTFFAALITAAIAVAGSRPRAAVAAGPVHRRSDAVQLLAVLQREGRLVDFLKEDIEPYGDAQIGAAVRAVHAGCRKALDEHVVIEPVMTEPEGSEVTIADGFDPSAVRLTGNVHGDPPFHGSLRHRGWRAERVTLPTDARAQDPDVVAPAEVEIA